MLIRRFKNIKTILYINLMLLLCFSSQSQIVWEDINLPTDEIIHSLVVDSNETIYLGSSIADDTGGIYLSCNGGDSWKNIGPQNYTVHGIELLDDSTILIAVDYGVFITRDLGTHWEELLSLTSTQLNAIFSINTDTIFAGGWNFLFRSIDGGISWDTNLVFNPAGAAIMGPILKNSQDFIFVHTHDFFGDGRIYRSNDYGSTWDTVFWEDVSSMEVDKNDVLFAGTPIQGLYKSIDSGENWDLINSNFYSARDMAVDAYNSLIMASGNNLGLTSGLFQSFDEGLSWEEIGDGLTNSYTVRVCISLGNFLYVVQYGPFLSKSVNPLVGLPDYSGQKSAGFRLYPNPASEQINLISDISFQSIDIEIEIYDSWGRNQTYTIGNSSMSLSSNVITLNIDHLQPGIYVVITRIGNLVRNMNFVKI